MRWGSDAGSGDVEDRRGSGFGGGAKIGCGGLLVLGLLSLLFKQDLISPFLGGGGVATGPSVDDPSRRAAEEPLEKTSRNSFGDLQDFWAQTLPQTLRVPYRKTMLVLFWDIDRSGCGRAEAATGPFYCPADEKVYIDLGFYKDLKQRFGAPGDFAQAYVIAHEVGHHIQKLTGIEEKVRAAQQRRPQLANQLSVRMELQADCYAGVWGHSANQRGILEPSEGKEATTAAAAIGDDRIQKMAGRAVQGESFTHGSSAQRVEWFNRGFSTGKPEACDTFQTN